ncbi:MAG: type II toxin-antitoxin system Phd/YefM family antitoxin [Caldilineaceae bacterium]|nr:type II toxin-antitoxin system Phd/YefM family antitoxin [Caldilineaceae bacterium]
MERIVSTTEAKAQLSGLMEWTLLNDDAVVVESHGNPKAVLISFTRYEQFRVWREQQRQKAALIELAALAESIQARNQNLSDAEADNLAERFGREIIEEMIAEGKIHYGADGE